MKKIKQQLLLLEESDLKGMTKAELVYQQTLIEAYQKTCGDDSDIHKRMLLLQDLIDGDACEKEPCSKYQEKAKQYIGMKVKVIWKHDKSPDFIEEGRIVGPSQAKNGSFVVHVDGTNEEVHHENITDMNGDLLKWIP
jgi:hypothetical protein